MGGKFKPREQNPKWIGGLHLSDKGYLRRSCSEGHQEYQHRYVIKQLLKAPLCASYVFPGDGVIPSHMQVHHADFCKTHNCEGNLILMERLIHAFCTKATVIYMREHREEYLAKLTAENTPDWVGESMDEGAEDGNREW